MGESHKWRLRYKDLKSLRFVAPPAMWLQQNLYLVSTSILFYKWDIVA